MLNKYLQPMLAGALIGLGDIAYVVIESHVLGSCLFSLGLLSILIKDYPLYTGRIGYVEKWSDLLDMLRIVVLNFIGIGIVCYAVRFSRLDVSGVNAIADVKVHQSWVSSLLLSWCCGVMMYLAVNGWKKTNNPLLVVMPIMFFILCGFEHCIANVGYICMADTVDVLPSIMSIAVMVVGNALGSLSFSKI